MNANERLKEIQIENYIWIIYLVIIGLSYYSNKLEKEYFLTNDLTKKKEYQEIIKLIFLVLNIIYLYFTIKGYKDLKENNTMYNKLIFIASVLILISGLIFLMISLTDDNLEAEIAFS